MLFIVVFDNNYKCRVGTLNALNTVPLRGTDETVFFFLYYNNELLLLLDLRILNRVGLPLGDIVNPIHCSEGIRGRPQYALVNHLL